MKVASGGLGPDNNTHRCANLGTIRAQLLPLFSFMIFIIAAADDDGEQYRCPLVKCIVALEDRGHVRNHGNENQASGNRDLTDDSRNICPL